MVDERPLAIRGPARLQPDPRAVDDRLVHTDRDAPEGTVDPFGGRDEGPVAVLEAETDAAATRDAVEDTERSRGVDLEPRVADEQASKRLAQLDGAAKVVSGRSARPAKELVLAEPAIELGGRTQRLAAVEDVLRIDEIPDQLYRVQ
jgi:hypothetical protein